MHGGHLWCGEDRREISYNVFAVGHQGYMFVVKRVVRTIAPENIRPRSAVRFRGFVLN